MLKLSAVIVNWYSSDLTERLIASVDQYPPSCDWEVIIVDNGSPDFDPGRFDRPQVTCIPCGENHKYARGNNIGAQRARGEYLLLLNPDIEFTEGSADALVDFLDAHGEYGAACPRLILPDGSTDRSVRGFPYMLPLVLSYLRIPSSYLMPYMDYDRESDVLQPMTSSLLIRKSVFDSLGGFDEQFPIFFNDVDLLYRAHLQGVGIRYLPSSRMKHVHGGSTRRADPALMKRESCLSLIRFYNKHFAKRYGPILTALFTAAIGLVIPKEGNK
ncbi:MAG: glycosyltransferase family 2 protein [Abditibacteriota bacterium]|nr:glycosyltransferase family 2 protein [Abditibacteriota bacterium]